MFITFFSSMIPRKNYNIHSGGTQMKKKLLFMSVVALFLCLAALPALAYGISGTATGSVDIRYENLQFAPVTGTSFTEGMVPWYCSVKLSPQNDKEWQSYYSTDVGRFTQVRVVLYRLNGSLYGGTAWQSYWRTLSAKGYDKVREASFSDGGLVQLPAGNYRISLETLWNGATGENYTTVCSNDFVVNPKPTPLPTATPAPQYATVTLLHQASGTGQILYQMDITAMPGNQNFYPAWAHQDYSLVSNSCVQLYVQANNHYYVTFLYAKNNITPQPTRVPTPVPTPRPTPKPTRVPTPRPATPEPGQAYDPENPFLYGIREYDYCMAPEYCVDPEQEPWNYCYLYSKASDINGRNMGRYDKGQVVKVIKYNGGNHGKWNYCYVMTKDNKLGYMHDYALKPIEESQVYYNMYILNNGVK